MSNSRAFVEIRRKPRKKDSLITYITHIRHIRHIKHMPWSKLMAKVPATAYITYITYIIHFKYISNVNDISSISILLVFISIFFSLFLIYAFTHLISYFFLCCGEFQIKAYNSAQFQLKLQTGAEFGIISFPKIPIVNCGFRKYSLSLTFNKLLYKIHYFFSSMHFTIISLTIVRR